MIPLDISTGSTIQSHRFNLFNNLCGRGAAPCAPCSRNPPATFQTAPTPLAAAGTSLGTISPAVRDRQPPSTDRRPRHATAAGDEMFGGLRHRRRAHAAGAHAAGRQLCAHQEHVQSSSDTSSSSSSSLDSCCWSAPYATSSRSHFSRRSSIARSQSSWCGGDL